MLEQILHALIFNCVTANQALRNEVLWRCQSILIVCCGISWPKILQYLFLFSKTESAHGNIENYGICVNWSCTGCSSILSSVLYALLDNWKLFEVQGLQKNWIGHFALVEGKPTGICFIWKIVWGDLLYAAKRSIAWYHIICQLYSKSTILV